MVVVFRQTGDDDQYTGRDRPGLMESAPLQRRTRITVSGNHAFRKIQDPLLTRNRFFSGPWECGTQKFHDRRLDFRLNLSKTPQLKHLTTAGYSYNDFFGTGRPHMSC
jgi:hypothetical protein